MKNSSKNNYFGKNSKRYKEDLNFNFYSKDKNSSKKKDRFPNSDSTNKVNNLNEIDKNKKNF